MRKYYLLVSDFDQTLSFNDSGLVLAAPWLVVHSALQGIVPPDHIIGGHFEFGKETGEIESVIQVPAGYGKVAAVDSLRWRLGVPSDRIVYVGDGSSDIHVMLHVNRGDGLTIAASETRHIAQIARRTVISDDALSVLIPILEEICGYDPSQIRLVFEEQGLLIQEWDRVRTDWLTIRDGSAIAGAA